jgi:hypothetical protein
MVTKCIACGMPMVNKEDFALGDMGKKFCRYCAKPDGSMQNYDEKLKSLTGFIIRTQGLAELPAQKVAVEMMSKLPAWQNQ